MEAEKQRRAEEKRKKQQMMAGALGAVSAAGGEGRNFTIEKGAGDEKLASLSGGGEQKKQGRGPSKEQLEEMKVRHFTQSVSDSDLFKNYRYALYT